MKETMEQLKQILANVIKMYNNKANNVLEKASRFTELKQFKKDCHNNFSKVLKSNDFNQNYENFKSFLSGDKDLEFINEISILKTKFPNINFQDFSAYLQCCDNIASKLDGFIVEFYTEIQDINNFILTEQPLIMNVSEIYETIINKQPITDIDKLSKVLNYLNLDEIQQQHILLTIIEYNNELLKKQIKDVETTNKTEDLIVGQTKIDTSVEPSTTKETEKINTEHQSVSKELIKEETKQTLIESVEYLKAKHILQYLDKLDYDKDTINIIVEKLSEKQIRDMIDIINEDLEVYIGLIGEDNEKNNSEDKEIALNNIKTLTTINDFLKKRLSIIEEEHTKKNSESKTTTEDENKLIFIIDDAILADIKDLKNDQFTRNRAKIMIKDLFNSNLDDIKKDGFYTSEPKLKRIRKRCEQGSRGLRLNYINLDNNIYILLRCFEKHAQNPRVLLNAISNRRERWLDINGKKTTEAIKLLDDLQNPETRSTIIAKNEALYNEIITKLTKPTNKVEEGRSFQ